jgi:hypothetical protein
MGYNFNSPIGLLNISAHITKLPGFMEDKKSLSASYMFKSKWSSLSFSYENTNNLDARTNKFSDPIIRVSGSFIL